MSNQGPRSLPGTRLVNQRIHDPFLRNAARGIASVREMSQNLELRGKYMAFWRGEVVGVDTSRAKLEEKLSRLATRSTSGTPSIHYISGESENQIPIVLPEDADLETKDPLSFLTTRL